MGASSLLLDPCDRESPPRERRTHARIPASELDWIQEVRLKYGPSVSLIDLSSGGALLHAPVQLQPGSTRVLEIVGSDVEAVPFHVLRCHIAYLSIDGPVYSGAGAFRRPFDVTPRRRAAPALRPDLALKELVQAQRQLAAAHSVDPRRAAGRTLSRVLRNLQTASGQDPLSSAVRQVLAEIVPAVERGETTAALQARLERCLRRSIPSLGIALSPAPLPALPGKETIYFAGSTAANGHPIVNVELAAGTAIPDWQFRLLQASGYLLEILSLPGLGHPAGQAGPCARAAPEEIAAPPESTAPLAPAVEPSPESRPGWQKIVVRYRQGDLVKGYTHDFHPSRQKFSLWPTLGARSNDRVHIPTCMLKAVFFVRDFDGNPDYEPQQTFADVSRRAGRHLEVKFEDGEVLVGTTLSYRPDSVGFFVEPADEGGNNQRVFVLRGATRHVRFL